MLQVSLINNIVNGVADETILLPGYIDVSGVTPTPEKGWIYDPETGLFSEPPIIVYLHFVSNKGKLLNDGIDALTVTITLYDTKKVVIPINRQVRIVLREDNGALYDLVWVDLVAGMATFNYSTIGRPAIVHIAQSDNYVDTIGSQDYKVIAIIGENVTLQIGRTV